MITILKFKDRTIKSYAIRKLTCKECFRLMGVRDNVIHIMQTTVKSVKKTIKKIFRKDNGNNESREFDEYYERIKAETGNAPKVYQDKVDAVRVVGVKRINNLGLPYWEFYREDKYETEKVEMTFDKLWNIATEGNEETIYYANDFDWEAESETAEETDTYRRFKIYSSTPGEYIKVEQKEGTEEMLISASQQYKQAGNSIVVDVLKYIYQQLIFPKQPKPQQQLSMFDMFFPEDVLPQMPPKPYGGGKFNVLTTFSGYDSQLMACDALKEDFPEFQWDCVGWSDIDKYACQMHDLVFPEYADKALGDITKIDWHKVKESLNGEEVDLFTYSSPCTDISQAGKQMGLAEGSGTRSALLWYVSDAIDVLRPKYLLQENVAALVSDKFMPDFQKWLDRLDSLGYVTKWQRLNAKQYGIPQNRDRVFAISMRKDVAFDYQFPEPIPLEKRLEDVLEEEVDSKYFLKDDAVGKFLKANDKDEALFLQFDIPPTHEDAMFLKTWLTIWMDSHNGWTKTATDLETAIPRTEFYRDWDTWKDLGTFPHEGFESIFRENMEVSNE